MLNSSWPLMKNNITRADLDSIINYLSQEDPILTNGPKVKEFESAWSNWLGVKYSVMVNSGSSANDLTMIAVKEFFGDGEVLVPTLAWVSDIAAVIHAGLTPKFIDIDRQTLAMDNSLILRAITKKTKAIFLTHVLGLNGITNNLISELTRLGIPLIEDVCESHGATYNNKKLGTFGWASNFSFYYAHHLTTIEGGMICTDDFDLYEMARMARAHGMAREASSSSTRANWAGKYPDLNQDFIFTMPAHNMRPSEINGILGLSQLARLDQDVLRRKQNFEKFLSIIDKNIFYVDFNLDGNSNYAFILILKEPNLQMRNKIEFLLNNAGIEFRRGLSGGGNQLRQPYLRRIPGMPNPELFPNVEHIHNFAWYIGNYPGIDDGIYSAISSALKLI